MRTITSSDAIIRSRTSNPLGLGTGEGQIKRISAGHPSSTPRKTTAHHWYASYASHPPGALRKQRRNIALAQGGPDSSIMRGMCGRSNIGAILRKHSNSANHTIEWNPHFHRVLDARSSSSSAEIVRKQRDVCKRVCSSSPQSPRLQGDLGDFTQCGVSAAGMEFLEELHGLAKVALRTPFEFDPCNSRWEGQKSRGSSGFAGLSGRPLF